MYIKKITVIAALLIGLATLFPPFLARGVRQWGFLFSPPVSSSEGHMFKIVVEAEIDWSILFAEYILALVISILIVYLWDVAQFSWAMDW